MPPRVLSSRIAYANPWMRVREDSLELPDGASGLYGVVERPDFCTVIPFDGESLYLVRQYRHAVGALSTEFPQGTAEDGELAPEELARRELKEETGLEAASLERLGRLYEAAGYSNQGQHVFLATGLAQGDPDPGREEQDLQVLPTAVRDFEAMARAGRIKDGATLAAYALLRLRCGWPPR